MRTCRGARMKGLGVWVWSVVVVVGCGKVEPSGTPEAAVELSPPTVHADAKEAASEPRPATGEGPAATGEGTATVGNTDESGARSSPGTTDEGTTGSEPTAAPAEPAPAEPGADGKTFTVDARLVDRGKRASHCGILHAVVVMKLEVVKVIDGRSDADTLYVYVSCPEMWMVGKPRRFELGTVYRWTLDTRIERRTAGTKLDAFTEVKAPRYRLQRLVLPPP